MARSPDAVDEVTDSNQQRGASSSRLRLPPERSDVRELGGGDEPVFELGGQGRAPLPPPPLGLEEALAQYGAHLPAEAELRHALAMKALPRAIVLLLRDHHDHLREVEALRSDFDALRRFNLEIEERMDDALGVADDQRLHLLEELERTHDAVFSLENQLQQERLIHDADLERCQSEREALKRELLDLEEKFTLYQARMWK